MISSGVPLPNAMLLLVVKVTGLLGFDLNGKEIKSKINYKRTKYQFSLFIDFQLVYFQYHGGVNRASLMSLL